MMIIIVGIWFWLFLLCGLGALLICLYGAIKVVVRRIKRMRNIMCGYKSDSSLEGLGMRSIFDFKDEDR